ncbi:MAG: hypothetical protein HKN47_29400 [Pirellulaceae bacterium]|nr:hypothetical protein [Pirellulaceae bacterium]
MTDPVRNPYSSQTSVDGGVLNGGAADGGELESYLVPFVRTGSIITLALAQGVVMIVAVLWFVGMSNRPVPDAADAAVPADVDPAAVDPAVLGGDGVLLAVGVGAAVLACIVAFILPRMIRRAAIDQYQQATPAEQPNAKGAAVVTAPLRQLLGASQTATLVGQAVLEGAAVLNAIMMFLNHNWIHLVPIAILLLGILIQMPTVQRKRDWIAAANRS